MIKVYLWWHRSILAHRIKGPSISMDGRGRFDFYKCQCGKIWAR